MQSRSLYNDMFTIITNSKVQKDLPTDFVNFYGSKEKVSYEIQKYQLENDIVFNGHFITTDLNFDIETLKQLKKTSLDKTVVYTYDITHSGVASECTIDTSLLLCSVWTLPIVLENYRTGVSLYGDLLSHRIKVKLFNRVL